VHQGFQQTGADHAADGGRMGRHRSSVFLPWLFLPWLVVGSCSLNDRVACGAEA
jgi:hypothetical protein